ncbi:hypothetical protein M0R04_08020 [Candidatus Dojkabacteria bacterium]|nr:hypothetical protein [Candidatus Dojkabacteria bacterium]
MVSKYSWVFVVYGSQIISAIFFQLKSVIHSFKRRLNLFLYDASSDSDVITLLTI